MTSDATAEEMQVANTTPSDGIPAWDDDVGHRHEGSDTAHQFAAHGSLIFCELEVAVERIGVQEAPSVESTRA
jgi:hypothetical protein